VVRRALSLLLIHPTRVFHQTSALGAWLCLQRRRDGDAADARHGAARGEAGWAGRDVPAGSVRCRGGKRLRDGGWRQQRQQRFEVSRPVFRRVAAAGAGQMNDSVDSKVPITQSASVVRTVVKTHCHKSALMQDRGKAAPAPTESPSGAFRPGLLLLPPGHDEVLRPRGRLRGPPPRPPPTLLALHIADCSRVPKSSARPAVPHHSAPRSVLTAPYAGRRPRPERARGVVLRRGQQRRRRN
jgi:hypothetical protein